MLWINTRGEKLMEFFLRNVDSHFMGYSLNNEKKSTYKKCKKIENQCAQIINSLITYLSNNREIDLDEMYFEIKKAKDDFWDKLFFHCTAQATTELLVENTEFEINKAVSRSFSYFANEMKVLLNQAGANQEYILLRLDLIKAKIEMNLITVSSLFHNNSISE